MDDATLPPMPPPRSPSPTLPEHIPQPSSESHSRSLPEVEKEHANYSDNNGELEPVNSSHDVPLKEEAPDHEGKLEGGKQKRKRTSPEDQAFLEAQYKENPKPNKAARAEIVKSVRLNEKEVQIWFQNRRQINRRKSRPLLPHEIAAFGLGLNPLSSDPASIVNYSSSQETDEQAELSLPNEALRILDNEVESRISQDVELPAPEMTSTIKSSEKVAEGTQKLPVKTEPSSLVSETPSKETRSQSISEALSQSFSATPGYLANRWNNVNPFSTPVAAHSAMFTTPTISRPIFPSSCPERITTDTTPSATSRVRLSTGLDGRAELVEGEITPPRSHAERPTSSLSSVIPLKRMRSLYRSHSALPLGSSSFNGPFTPRLLSGRSRDARTWEFCAEGEPRDELTTQAENESSGSAIAAISLIRSTSSSALKPNPNKRNTLSRPNLQGKRPKMGRASSSVARMQSGVKKAGQPINDKDPSMRSPSGDSDKENWVPPQSGVNPRRRPAHTQKESDREPKGILQDNPSIPTHVDFGVNRNKRRKSAHSEPQVYEDAEASTKNNKAPDDDVQNFMQAPVSPSKKDDVDCIQGLLSLSQGNWR
ncbi:putative homeobox domain-containing protein [Botrytis fragariae]|uniref:Putative homeobox domain-containing protein n=1 Tax=Botrytis fragariae TaxID=1964551 RepID=A0A8H6B3M4_9HELO|nr:putative homeobox domain-containing protein [Botrytis fragariae]KAF5878412.1 putative homeobox domain-containing protein [Botrytis fragariae]